MSGRWPCTTDHPACMSSSRQVAPKRREGSFSHGEPQSSGPTSGTWPQPRGQPQNNCTVRCRFFSFTGHDQQIKIVDTYDARDCLTRREPISRPYLTAVTISCVTLPADSKFTLQDWPLCNPHANPPQSRKPVPPGPGHHPSFCAWLIPLSVASAQCTCAVADGSISFFVSVE